MTYYLVELGKKKFKPIFNKRAEERFSKVYYVGKD